MNKEHVKEKNNQMEMYFLYSSILQTEHRIRHSVFHSELHLQNVFFFTLTDALPFFNLHPEMEETAGGGDESDSPDRTTEGRGQAWHRFL